MTTWRGRLLGSSVVLAVSLFLPLHASAAPPDTDSAPAVTAANAVPGQAPAGSDAKAVYLDSNGYTLAAAGSQPQASADADTDASTEGSSALALKRCTPQTNVDNPHYSSGDVSAHGSWNKGTCTHDTAHVQNCLYEWFTDNTWRQKACSNREKLKPYTGSGQRTVARATCTPTAGLISWRNHVDVDVDGQADTAEVPMKQAEVNCYVY